MSASNPSGGRIAAENELLAQLGLPPSASPEDVDQLHLAVSQYLAAAPSSIRGWAHAQAAALDEAYLQLTDPVGLEGSALRSPTRPPTVVPGGPVTPPARRDPVPAVASDMAAAPAGAVAVEPGVAIPAEADDIALVDGETDDDVDALYASVTPSANADMVPSAKDRAARRGRRGASTAAAVPAAPVAAPQAGRNIWKWISLGGAAVIVVAVAFLGANMVLNGGIGGTANGATSQPSPTAQAVDLAKVNTLMQQLAANPRDVDTLIALGDEYYFGNQYDVAGQWYDKALAVDPKSVKALNAKGAVLFSTGDLANAETTWKQVLTLDSKNTEAHFNLAFLYAYQPTPDMASAVREWNTVIALDPSSTFAQVAQQHLQSLAAASMLPSSSGTPTASGSPAASSAPSASGSPAASGAASPAPSGSASPGGSPAAAVVNEAASNSTFVDGTLNAPAGVAFTLHFDNRDSGMPHDILIKDSAGNTVFHGDMVIGPRAVDYAVPALAAGTYTFTCTIHPTTMNGTLVVGG